MRSSSRSIARPTPHSTYRVWPSAHHDTTHGTTPASACTTGRSTTTVVRRHGRAATRRPTT
ncbi:Uncharacterised protein [Mycobacteroides abscessus]|nr:Uncharacterised protein [Mycobacteroides abscessus]